MAEELGLVMGPPSSAKESTPVVMDAKPENSNIAIAKPEPEKEKMSNINVQPVNVQHLNVQPVNVQAVKEEVAGSKVAAGEGLGSQQVQVVKKLIQNWRQRPTLVEGKRASGEFETKDGNFAGGANRFWRDSFGYLRSWAGERGCGAGL